MSPRYRVTLTGQERDDLEAFRHRARAVFVAAGFHDARARRQRELQILFRQKIQQVDKGKCRAKQQ